MDQKSKLEQLFLWKISEELKLSIKEEKLLGDIVQELNRRRQDLSDKIQEQIKNMSLRKDDQKYIETALGQYKNLLKQQADINLEEIERIKKALGSTKASQYLVVKSELSLKVKGLLGSPDKAKD